jgi:hypothetical protein
MLFKVALGLATLAAGVVADDKQDLGSVLAGNKNLTKFYDLIKVGQAHRFNFHARRPATNQGDRNIPTSCWSFQATLE